MDPELINFIAAYILTFFVGKKDLRSTRLVKKHVRAFIDCCEHSWWSLDDLDAANTVVHELTTCGTDRSFIERLSAITSKLVEYSTQFSWVNWDSPKYRPFNKFRPTYSWRLELLADWIALIPSRLHGNSKEYEQHAKTFSAFYDLCRSTGKPLAITEIRPWTEIEACQPWSADGFVRWICFLEHRLRWKINCLSAPPAALRRLRFKPPHKVWKADHIEVGIRL